MDQGWSVCKYWEFATLTSRKLYLVNGRSRQVLNSQRTQLQFLENKDVFMQTTRSFVSRFCLTRRSDDSTTCTVLNKLLRHQLQPETGKNRIYKSVGSRSECQVQSAEMLFNHRAEEVILSRWHEVILGSLILIVIRPSSLNYIYMSRKGPESC